MLPTSHKTPLEQMEVFQLSTNSNSNKNSINEWIESIPIQERQPLTQEQQEYLTHFERMLIDPLQRRIQILEKTTETHTPLWDFTTFTFSDFYSTYGRDLPPPHNHLMIREFQKRIDWKYSLEKEYQRLKQISLEKVSHLITDSL
jgi:hypothetical protein